MKPPVFFSVVACVLGVVGSALAATPGGGAGADDARDSGSGNEDVGRSRGVTLRVYRLENTLSRVPELVEGQTPNVDRLIQALNVRGDGAFGGVPAPIVTTLQTWVRIGGT